MLDLLNNVCAIDSRTFKEQEICKFFKDRLNQHFGSTITIDEHKDSLIVHFQKTPDKKHICLVGHSDVVSPHFKPYTNGNKFHGAGASDMKAALAAYLYIIENHHHEILQKYNLSLIIYSREEGTTVEENGLYDLIQEYPHYFKSIDLAIIGEPTDNTVQIGCVGSLHAKVKIKGLACHSARPWNGENALYKALPFINKISELQPKKFNVFGVDFFDVIQITESHTEPGRTTLPGYWEANINYRFAPVKNSEKAEEYIKSVFNDCGLNENEYTITDTSNSGAVIENDSFKEIVQNLGVKIEAKQAWTDVAQLTALGVAAFNYGPGLTSQAHKDNEYTHIDDYKEYIENLTRVLTT